MNSVSNKNIQNGKIKLVLVYVFKVLNHNFLIKLTVATLDENLATY